MLQALPTSRGYRVKAVSVPAPVGGLNSRDSIDAMAPTDALIMSNFFPTVEKVTLRDGYTSFCTGIGTGNVETLVEHNAGANRQLLAIGSNGTLYQIDSGTAVSKKPALQTAGQKALSSTTTPSLCRQGRTCLLAGTGQAPAICRSRCLIASTPTR
jgi:hypothetical protein